jgi:UDP-N-acetyl-2-amino-2-deoxyglucuronate dehydrogenase
MIKFGLLGCGRIAKRHSDLLGGHVTDRASLAGVCDPIRARADAIASKFGLPPSYISMTVSREKRSTRSRS